MKRKERFLREAEGARKSNKSIKPQGLETTIGNYLFLFIQKSVKIALVKLLWPALTLHTQCPQTK